jgi:subtilisin-like proprotein convertase family protein
MKKLITIAFLITFSFLSKAQTFTWSGSLPILDLHTDTIPIAVSGLPNAINGSFGIGHACVTLLHTYDSDVTIKLMSPDGSIVILIQNMGGANDNFFGTCLAMDGTDFNNLVPPYSGLVVPVGNLASLNNGQNPNGIWKFIVSDVANSDQGTLQELNLEFTNNPPGGSNSGGPTGVAICATCVCPGGALGCDLLPDMTSSAKEIMVNHQETPGFLDISNATPNIGYGPIEIFGIDSCFCGTTYVPCGTTCPGGQDIQHVVKQRIYHKNPGNDTLTHYDRFAGMMSYHATHGHIHVDNWANYTLRVATSNPDPKTWPIIGTGTKQSFCLINLGSCSGNPGECVDNNGNTILTVPNNGVGFHTGCGLNQGIYPGQYDVYSMGLNDPIVLNNVCNGTYYIVSITDPDNNFLESDETNNTVAVPITLTQQNATPTITPSGSTTICPGDSVILTSNTASNYLWSTGETTQSIVVKTSGSYTVSSTCGASSATSSPVVVTVISGNVNPAVSIAITSGSNPMCLAASVTLTATPTNGGASPSYQWKVNGVNVGTNSPTYTASNYTNGQIVTCVMTSNLNCATTTTATSNSITMLVSSTVCYCLPVYATGGNYGCLDGDVIARVILNTLDNNSGAGCPSGIAGYSNYSASSNPLHTTTLQAGNSYNCTVYAGQYPEGYALWIDYNDDGVFSAAEKVGNTTTVVAGSGSVGVVGSSRIIPVSISCNAPAGPHRMRVRCVYNLAGPTIDPCIYQSNYGEVEDYTITISGSLSCPKPTAQTATAITSNSATLGWTTGCSETLWNVHVTTLGGGAPSGAPSNPGVSNPLNRTGLNPGTQYEFWVAADCNSAGNGTSQWAGPFAFTTLSNCSGVAGTSFANPIIVGEAPCATAPYVNTQTNSTANCFSNNYTGTNNQSSPDIWYKFTLSLPATVQVSHCAASGLADSYLHILNSAGTQIFVNDDNGPLCTGNRASISAALAAGTYYVVSEGFSSGVGVITTTIKTTTACSVTSVINITAFIEGFYLSNGQMSAVLNLNGMSNDPTACDSITVELHTATFPYATASSVKTLLHKNGTATINVPASLYNQSYYIAIKHRNAIETWSSAPILISAVKSYDFTTALKKAYGNNLADLGDGRFALFSGDISDATLGIGFQDGVIESQDYGDLENAVSITLLGYKPEDLTGDNIVESGDYVIIENNVFFTRVMMRP